MGELEAGALSPLALAILELLDERPMHPYEMASTMRQRHHDEFIRLNFGSLYHTVDSLEGKGWIVPSEREKEGRRPERTIYKLTASGRTALTETLADLLRRPVREYPHFVAGLMFMHHLKSHEAAAHLAERAVMLEARIGKLEGILKEFSDRGFRRLSLIELEHKIAMLDAERKWVRKLEREINEGKLQWKVGIEADHKELRGAHGTSTH